MGPKLPLAENPPLRMGRLQVGITPARICAGLIWHTSFPTSPTPALRAILPMAKAFVVVASSSLKSIPANVASLWLIRDGPSARRDRVDLKAGRH